MNVMGPKAMQCNPLGNAFTRPEDMDLHPYFIYILGLVIGLHPTVNRMTLWVEQHSILSYNQTNQQYNIQYSIDRGNRVPCSDKTMIRELLSSLLRFEGLKEAGLTKDVCRLETQNLKCQWIRLTRLFE